MRNLNHAESCFRVGSRTDSDRLISLDWQTHGPLYRETRPTPVCRHTTPHFREHCQCVCFRFVTADRPSLQHRDSTAYVWTSPCVPPLLSTPPSSTGRPLTGNIIFIPTSRQGIKSRKSTVSLSHLVLFVIPNIPPAPIALGGQLKLSNRDVRIKQIQLEQVSFDAILLVRALTLFRTLPNRHSTPNVAFPMLT
jgi:hypothetical protein